MFRSISFSELIAWILWLKQTVPSQWLTVSQQVIFMCKLFITKILQVNVMIPLPFALNKSFDDDRKQWILLFCCAKNISYWCDRNKCLHFAMRQQLFEKMEHTSLVRLSHFLIYQKNMRDYYWAKMLIELSNGMGFYSFSHASEREIKLRMWVRFRKVNGTILLMSMRFD